MPEAPDLHVLREYLAPRLMGREIDSVRELRPLVLRNLVGTPMGEHAEGRRIEGLARKGKLLIMELSGDMLIVVSPMLTGELSITPPNRRMLKSTILTMNLDDGMQIRYTDAKRMGQVYYLQAGRLDEITRVTDQGPDVFDEPLKLVDFKAALKRYRGEVKGVLTRGQLVAGIGNAYADEVLWEAGVYPFRKVTRLTVEEIFRLHDATYRVPAEAAKRLRKIFGEGHPRKERKFLSVHGKSGTPCPRCGTVISSVKSRQRDTNFCRGCQPGTMFE